MSASNVERARRGCETVARGDSDHEAACADFVARFTAGWAHPEPATLVALLTPSARARAPLTPEVRGRQQMQRVFESVLELMPDLHVEVHDWASFNDGVFIEFTLSGSLGKRLLRWDVVDLFVLEGSLASERVTYFDSMPLLTQTLRVPRGWPALLRSGSLPRWSRSAAPQSCACPAQADGVDVAERFVARFAAYWARPTVAGYLELLDSQVELDLPSLGRVRGREQARAAVRRRLQIAPDLTANVIRWGGRGASVFVELQFALPTGHDAIRWNAVNRFQLREDRALRARSYEDSLVRMQLIATRPRLLLNLLRATIASR